jgi:hypothetical protein
MSVRVILAGVLAGIAMFVMGSLTHMVLGVDQIQSTPLEDELIAATRHALPGAGVYLAPSLPMDIGKRPKAEQDRLMKELDQKVRVNPRLLVVLAPPAKGLFTPSQFLWQLAGDVLAGLCLALLLGLANGPRAWAGRVAVCLAGVLAGSFMARLPYWNWYGFPAAFTRVEVLDDVLRGGAAALVAAAMVKPRG